jgi:hypothetical protein
LQADAEKVAVLKEQQEDVIEEALEELGPNFPRLENLDHIYPSTRIRELVVLIYKDVIKFARESAPYYQQSSTSK